MKRLGFATLSLRAQLLLGILAPVALLVIFNSVSLYRKALTAADTAYDRTLLASAKSIGELLEVDLDSDGLTPKLRGNVLYSALEPFEADNRSRMFYRVTGFAGELISGFDDLPAWRGPLPQDSIYAALVHFYDDRFRGEPVRVAVLLQPVAGQAGLGMATIQVAETLELRRALARQLMLDTLWREALLLAVIAAVVVAVVQRATRPVRALSSTLRHRHETDLSPVAHRDASPELRPVIDAVNTVMSRMTQVLEHQKRFVRDASHQLRTPLAVLKTQLQSARRGDVPAEIALPEIALTVERATTLANQMLALAKVEQLRHQHHAPTIDAAAVVRGVALELSALIAERRLDFEIHTEPVRLRGHEWALRELTRNLVHNAIKYSPAGARLTIRLVHTGAQAKLVISDDGPGISAEQRERLFEPFASGAASMPGQEGSGLGLAICRDIVLALGGTIRLINRPVDAGPPGLDAVVELPLAPPPS